MTQLTSEFFADDSILFLDLTEKGLICPISRNAIKVMEKRDIKVCKIQEGIAEELNSMKKVPSSAFILCGKHDMTNILHNLSEKGIQRILFHPFHIPEKSTVDTCRAYGINTIIGCPMMLFGKGLCKIHASLIQATDKIPG